MCCATGCAWRATICSKALPELDAAERRRVLRRHYRVFADVLFELPRVAVMAAEELRARMRLPDLPGCAPTLQRGHPVLLLTGHQCNWEWLLQAVALDVGVPFLCAYKPPHSESADRLMLGLRGRFGVRMVPGKRLLREVLRRRGTVHAIGMVADQMPTSSAGPRVAAVPRTRHRVLPGPGRDRARRARTAPTSWRCGASGAVTTRRASSRWPRPVRISACRGIHRPLRGARRSADPGIPGRLGVDPPALEAAAARSAADAMRGRLERDDRGAESRKVRRRASAPRATHCTPQQLPVVTSSPARRPRPYCER